MSNQEVSKLEFFVNLFNNLLHTRNLIIFIGHKGVTLSIFKKKHLQKSIFIKHEDKNIFKECYKFLLKYKQYHITFLLDHKDCELKHERIPLLGSIFKLNPIEKFISDNYDPNDIVAYNTYKITKKTSEAWYTTIASTPFVAPVNKLLDYVINTSLKYSGMYFLSLEFATIIERILQKTQNTECIDHLQIFITITQSSDIRIIVKHKKNILDEQTIEYPKDKSNEYIQGTIEQSVADKILFYKEYIEKFNLPVCIIYLVDTALKELLSNSSFDQEAKIIALSSNDICLSKKLKGTEFQDNTLLEIFNNFNTNLALNKPLKTITKLTFLNNVFFKPLIIILIGIIGTLLTIKYQTWKTDYATEQLNQKYYSISKDYKQIQKNRPDLKDISDLVDFYNLEFLINKTAINPVENLKHILEISSSELKFRKIDWNINNPINIDLSQQNLNITINYEYKGGYKSAISGIKTVNNYANYINSVFQGNDITYTRIPGELKYVAKNVIVPAYISIKEKTTNKEVGDDYAR